MTPADYPTPEEIAEWDLPVLDAAPEVARTWQHVEPCIAECDWCGGAPVAPLTAWFGVYDGDPAVCLGCGSVFAWAVDAESGPHLQDPHAILSREALAALIATVEGAP